ncbi:MAG: DUF1232 domain-containing protein [Akkermansia sp.]|nr:DUF1232 domain-containing protein [Akkermansia sp.]
MDNKQQTAIKLVQEAQKGSLKSLRSIVYYILALVYIVSPVDFIPDSIMGLGQLDDGVVLLAVLWYVIRLLRQNRQK